jgi:plastocyanin
MDKTRYGLVGVVVAMVLTILLGNPGIVQAQEKCLPVYIRSHAGVEPEVMNVAKGDCVVWINWTRGEDVQVNFREGKRCADATKSPVRFKPDFSGCYLTDYLGFGETSSLVFSEPGAYRYEVEFRKSGGGLYGAGGLTKISGSILVK